MSMNDNIKLRIEYSENDYPILINKNSTIQNLKIEIKKKLNINYDEQVLICGGYILENNKLIKDYNMINDDKIILIKKKKENDFKSMNVNIDENKNNTVENTINNNNNNNNNNNKNKNKNNNNNNNNIIQYQLTKKQNDDNSSNNLIKNKRKKIITTINYLPKKMKIMLALIKIIIIIKIKIKTLLYFHNYWEKLVIL